MDFMHTVEPRGIEGVGIYDGNKNVQWRLFAVHASTDDNKRKEQWKVLSHGIEATGNRCLLIGDFNDILEDTEKEGGNYRSVASIRDFNEFIVSNGLLDLGFVSYPFTWRNRRDEGPIQQRLD
ncbi:hypothetical protein ACFX15_018345 [Malus domestica]